MNEVTELVSEASTEPSLTAPDAERRGERAGPEAVYGADAHDVLAAVDEVPAAVAPVPADRGRADPHERALAERPQDEPARAFDRRRHARGAREAELRHHHTAIRRDRDPGGNAEEAERVVEPERLVD